MKNSLKLYVLFALVLLLSLLSAKAALAQDSADGYFTQSGALKIGDRVPNFKMRGMQGSTKWEAELNDFRNKLIVLDFWNLGCSPCINGIPKMEDIQDHFGDDVKILLINSVNSDEEMKKVGFPGKTRLRNLNNTNLPVIWGNNIFEKFFPHQGEPYHVWIDQHGTICAMTNGYNTSRETIRYFLDSGKIIIPVKRETSIDLELSDNGRELSNGQKIENFRHQSFIGGPLLERVYRYNNLKGEKTGSLIFDMNQSIVNLYAAAFGTSKDRVRVKCSNPERFYESSRDNLLTYNDWLKNNTYCYALHWAANKIDVSNLDLRRKLKRIMQVDLEVFFGIPAEWVELEESCWVFKRTSAIDKVSSLNSKDPVSETRNGVYYSDGATLSSFIEKVRVRNALNMRSNYVIVLDETGLASAPVDLEIDAPVDDIDKLNLALKRYDLTIAVEKRKMRMLVLKPND